MSLPFGLLQMVDSACPTGGFAHSYGVEELFRAGLIGGADDLLNALTSYVEESLAGRELVFVALSWDAGSVADEVAIRQLVQVRRATRLTRSARDADVSRGQALHRVLNPVLGPSDLLAAAAGSHAILLGVAGAVFGADRQSVLRAGAFSHVSGMTQAAVRLGRIGPTGAQQILGRLAGPLAQAVDDSEGRSFGEWHGFSPLWELAQARHEHVPSPMFVT